MKVTACNEKGSLSKESVGMQVLNVGSFLQTGIMLLKLVTIDRIIQKEGEVGIQIEK